MKEEEQQGNREGTSFAIQWSQSEFSKKFGSGPPMEAHASASVVEYLRHADVNLPKRLRGQKRFVRFLKKVGADAVFIEQVERFRDEVLLSGLRRNQECKGLTIGVTSPRGGEGASLTALLLGLALGECSHRRIALLDGRFNAARFEAISSMLGLTKNSVNIGKGFSEVSGYYNETSPNLYFLRNSVSERSVDFFSDKLLGSFLENLRLHFDFTIIDLPPLLKDASPLFVLPHIDRLYLVLEASRTRISEGERCKAIVERSERQIDGIVINKQRAPWWSRLIWRDYFF